MTIALSLLKKRRFLPLFITQFFNAFNDNFFKMAMVILVTFSIYRDPTAEATFNAIAGALFILPYFLFSALAGQLADTRDKTQMIRIIKSSEIAIMIVGTAGIYAQSIPVMLAALFAMGVQSTFFGPIKYAILPHHLKNNEVLAGTGWVEAGTYIAILGGTIVGGILPAHWSIIGIMSIAVIARISASQIPPSPPEKTASVTAIDYRIFRTSWRLVRGSMQNKRLFLAIIAISFFWAIGAILAAQFPPLVKNSLGGDNTVATLFTAIFSIGIAIGSLLVNHLLKGQVSARFSPAAMIVTALFTLDLWWSLTNRAPSDETILSWREFLASSGAPRLVFDILGIAIAEGVFVVPLYAFLTTTVAKSQTARIIAANNIVNAGFMVVAALALGLFIKIGVGINDSLLIVFAICVIAAWMVWKLTKYPASSDRLPPAL